MVKLKGKYVIARIDGAGVFFGVLVKNTAKKICLVGVRKLYYWSGANAPEQLAVDGVKYPEKCQFTVVVDYMECGKPLQIIPCTDKAIQILKNVPEWKL